jgi:UDP-glucose 4-epimerase
MCLQKKNRRVLVAGAGGFIGRHVVERFVSEQIDVTGLDLFAPPLFVDNIDWIIGSTSDEALFASAVRGVEVVVYLASGSLPASANNDIAAEIDSHVRTTIKAAEICCNADVQTFVFASSGGTVYGLDADVPLKEDCATFPLSAYGVSKLTIEHYLRIISRLHGMRTVALRISNPFGEGQRAVRSHGFVAAAMSAAIKGTTLPIWGDGSIVRDFVYAADVGRAFSAACRYDGPSAVFNIGSGEGRSLSEIVKLVELVCKRAILVEYYPYRKLDVRRNVLDVTQAKNILGWNAEVTLEEGMKKTAEWWMHPA